MRYYARCKNTKYLGIGKEKGGKNRPVVAETFRITEKVANTDVILMNTDVILSNTVGILTNTDVILTLPRTFERDGVALRIL